jgi:hypothetical protein
MHYAIESSVLLRYLGTYIGSTQVRFELAWLESVMGRSEGGRIH